MVIATWDMLRIGGYRQVGCFSLEEDKPTVSPLMIPLVYCHIKSFQRASSVEKLWPGGEKRRDGRASHHVELGGDWGVAPPVCAIGVSLRARGYLIGATPRGSAVDVCSDAPARAQRAERAADDGVVDVSRALLCVARCTANSCAARGSM